MAIHNSRYKRPTDSDRELEATKKQLAEEQSKYERQSERDDFITKAVAALEGLRTDEYWDARRAYELGIKFSDTGDAMVVAHSKVFPSYSHKVPAGQLERNVSLIDGSEEEDDGEGAEGAGERPSL